MTVAQLQHSFFDYSPGTRAVFGRWAARVNDAIE